jgi:hypothetical protein
MSEQSAFAFGLGTFVGMLLYAGTYAYNHNGRWGDLGWEGAVIGGILFSALLIIGIFVYASIVRRFRHEESVVHAPAVCALVGIPYWLVLTPLHEYLRDRLGLPDSLWFAEMVLLCVLSFEVARFIAARRQIDNAPN